MESLGTMKLYANDKVAAKGPMKTQPGANRTFGYDSSLGEGLCRVSTMWPLDPDRLTSIPWVGRFRERDYGGVFSCGHIEEIRASAVDGGCAVVSEQRLGTTGCERRPDQ
jgi:hypothetical protein